MPLSYFLQMGHLGFLGNILVYVLILLPIFGYLKNDGKGKIRRALISLMSHLGGPLLISLFLVLEVLWVNPQQVVLYASPAIILFGIRFLQFETQAPGLLIAIESNCWIFGLFGYEFIIRRIRFLRPLFGLKVKYNTAEQKINI